ncbi:hypothetical protein TCAL_08221 [Tigriopus californicus]|uniref:Pre-mRNA-splicing factor Syf1/CRNKL1-like C-terminal HAT-repeats domain-containing protein n=2 Tax=Tigriopus californicus TaxID=6832 RepID=A0A553NFE4_TIGCA|nr:protein crooked neck-like [Tigriopus californicus]TRY64125.1 hypothetical protein TCAL_08221 [Tigriopus californicus]
MSEGAVGKGGGARPPKVARVKNKAPAELQITAEQLLREAKERQLEIVPAPPKQTIADAAELADFQMRKRKSFEDAIRKSGSQVGQWMKYAGWEEAQKGAGAKMRKGEGPENGVHIGGSAAEALRRARSVYERALDAVGPRNISLWIKYAEMEMRNKQVNHARNLWDRAVTILPRANQLWYKYTYMEEMLENIPGCRAVFERWMEWEPEEQAWLTYIKFELRYREIDRARAIYERFVYVHPEVKNWTRYAKFEEGHGFIKSARSIYERAVEFFGEEYMDERLFIAFSKFEENQKEHDRARVIYKYALDLMPKDSCVELYKAYTVHEKKFGERAGIETVILKKRKLQYEAEIAESPMNYDAWFDLIRLTMSEGDSELVRETFERAIANIPPSKEKQFWRRYIYLWINYAVFEELEAADMDRARQVYLTCLEYIPHKKFTFAKVWLLYAQFEIRQKNVRKARLAMGTALGKCPKAKLFRGYIDLEIQLREFERCRTLYEKFLLFDPENCSAWMKFAELEALLGDVERARGIYELAVNQPRLDMPELLWKAYIDFENDQEEFDKARQLYRALLNRTQHVKVWLSFAQFELGQREDDDKATARARRIYEEANNSLREVQTAEKEPRVMLLEAWREFEREHGEDTDLKRVMDLMPRRVKKRRKIETDNESAGWEEYFDYIFPEDESAKPNLKLLAMAKMWKKQKEMVPSDTPAPPLTQTPKTTKTSEEKGQEGKEGGKKEEEEQSQETTNATANPDADDEDMKNESSSDEEDEDGDESQTEK